MYKHLNEASTLIEDIASNNVQWPSKRVNPRKVASVYKSYVLSILTAQVAIISR
ncbi:hypothetical protein MA16_Dca014876 [Dendrobium catenatum]|uniref:Uncharacterized protein n=1 Tax=Dendrobium catenatum TaxID=906689 RepID=A0A2I0V6V1_9ASPA|nr:hypothetical protein MA16_Dca014876 [Dendrobium catenatum]